MITVVYTMNQGKAIMVAAFLMQSDADTYMKNEKLLETKKTCVDGWAGGSTRRCCARGRSRRRADASALLSPASLRL